VQVAEAYGKVGGNLIAALEVPEEEVSSYGVIARASTIQLKWPAWSKSPSARKRPAK
jgi:UTP--glucose-1-phosphate uridylyltransferase